jgi:hypothetical protein
MDDYFFSAETDYGYFLIKSILGRPNKKKKQNENKKHRGNKILALI